jgi:hypothetical protein
MQGGAIDELTHRSAHAEASNDALEKLLDLKEREFATTSESLRRQVQWLTYANVC